MHPQYDLPMGGFDLIWDGGLVLPVSPPNTWPHMCTPLQYDLHMGGFDLIWDGGPVLRFDKPTSLPTMLGAYNERDKTQWRCFKVRARSRAHSETGVGAMMHGAACNPPP